MNETLEIIQSEFAQASFETFEMVLISMIAAAILVTAFRTMGAEFSGRNDLPVCVQFYCRQLLLW